MKATLTTPATFAVLTLFLPTISTCNADINVPPRSEAQKHVAESIAFVEGHMDSDSQIVRHYLVDMLATPVGDDQRVRVLCAEVIAKSANRDNVISALYALQEIANDWLGLFGKAKQKRMIAEALSPALRSDDVAVRMTAASVLATLGGSYRATALQALLPELRTDHAVLAMHYLILRFGDQKEVVDNAISRTESAEDSVSHEGLKELQSILGNYYGPYHRTLNDDEVRNIFDCLSTTTTRNNRSLALRAAELLEQIGRKEAAFSAYRILVSSPIAANDAAARSEAIKIVTSKFLNSHDARDAEAIRAAERSNALLSAFTKQVDDNLQTGAFKQFQESQVERWKMLLKD